MRNRITGVVGVAVGAMLALLFASSGAPDPEPVEGGVSVDCIAPRTEAVPPGECPR